MDYVAIFVGIFGLVTCLGGIVSIDEWKRILEYETESLRARMQDIQEEVSFIQAHQGKKRKRDDALSHWMAEGLNLVREGRRLLKHLGRPRCSLVDDAKLRWQVRKLVDALRAHDRKGGVLRDQALSDARGLPRGFHFPIKQIVGQVASETLDQLKVLLDDDDFGRIAIQGEEGIGKTFLMKHLHNYALGRFDYVFWVSSPDEFTIKSVQNAVAAVVNCDIANDDDPNVRAVKLQEKFVGLGRFALFLDGVTGIYEPNIITDCIGIPVVAGGSECKLILSARSASVCRMLKCSATVKVKRLPGEETWQLFMHEARIGKESISSLEDMPRLLADTCCGVPRMTVNLATRMYGKNDPREWRYELFQSGCYGEKNKLPAIPNLEDESRRPKKNMQLSGLSAVSLG